MAFSMIVNFKCFILEAKMEENEMHFCYLMFFHFQKLQHCTNSKNICAIYEDSAIAESFVCKWLARFRSGNFHLEDQECSSYL